MANYASFLLRSINMHKIQREAVVKAQSEEPDCGQWHAMLLKLDEEISWRSNELAEEILNGNLPRV